MMKIDEAFRKLRLIAKAKPENKEALEVIEKDFEIKEKMIKTMSVDISTAIKYNIKRNYTPEKIELMYKRKSEDEEVKQNEC